MSLDCFDANAGGTRLHIAIKKINMEEKQQ